MSEEEQKYFKGLIGFTFDSDDIRYIEKIVDRKDKEIERLNIIINRIKSIYSSLCFSAPENNYIFIEQLGEVLQELKGSDKE